MSLLEMLDIAVILLPKKDKQVPVEPRLSVEAFLRSLRRMLPV